LFKNLDPESTGVLTYKQFFDSFKDLAYDLTENDVRAMLALAEEDEDHRIPWEPFVPVGLAAIRTFLSRNKQLAKKHTLDRTVNKVTMRLLYRLEVKKIDDILQKRFKHCVYDEESKKHAGTIPFAAMSEILHKTSWLSPKEVKLILRQYAVKYGHEEVDYSRFAEDLH